MIWNGLPHLFLPWMYWFHLRQPRKDMSQLWQEHVIWNFEQVIVAVPSLPTSIGNLGLPFRLCLPHQVKQLHIFHFRTWSMLAPFSRRSLGHHPITVIIFFHFEAATWRSNCCFAKVFFAHKKRGLIWFQLLKLGLEN